MFFYPNTLLIYGHLHLEKLRSRRHCQFKSSRMSTPLLQAHVSYNFMTSVLAYQILLIHQDPDNNLFCRSKGLTLPVRNGPLHTSNVLTIFSTLISHITYHNALGSINPCTNQPFSSDATLLIQITYFNLLTHPHFLTSQHLTTTTTTQPPFLSRIKVNAKYSLAFRIPVLNHST